MTRKSLFLIASILAFLVFIGYMTESGPIRLLGRSINIWVIRIAWLLIALANFINYRQAKKTEEIKN